MFCLVYSRPHGSFSVACFFTSSELMMHGTITARSGIVRRSLRDEIDADRVVVDHDELLGLAQRAGAHLERSGSRRR